MGETPALSGRAGSTIAHFWVEGAYREQSYVNTGSVEPEGKQYAYTRVSFWTSR